MTEAIEETEETEETKNAGVGRVELHVGILPQARRVGLELVTPAGTVKVSYAPTDALELAMVIARSAHDILNEGPQVNELILPPAPPKLCGCGKAGLTRLGGKCRKCWMKDGG